MAVPSKKQFDAYVSMSETFLERMMERTGFDVRELSFDGKFEKLLPTVDAIYSHNIAQGKVVDQMPVSKWLDRQPAFKRFERALWGAAAVQSSVVPGSEIAERMFEHVTKPRTMADSFNSDRYPFLLQRYPTPDDQRAYIDQLNSPEERAKRLDRAFRSWALYNPYTIYGDIVRAFSEYHYGDRASQLATEGKASAEVAKKVLAALNTLLDAKEQGLLPLQRLSRAVIQLVRTKADLDVFLEHAAVARSPIRRLDATAKERALAYDLWVAIRKRFRSNKPKAIFYLLEFEGVASPPDFRALERMVSDWADERTRQLERENSVATTVVGS